MISKSYIYFIIFLLFQACSLKYSSPTISELITLEDNLIKNYKPLNNKNKAINEILHTTLNDMKLPKDFAILKVIHVGIPTMYSGISQKIYISKNLIKSISKRFLLKEHFKLLLMHELIHKKLRHANKSLSQSQIYGNIKVPSFNNVLNISAQIAAYLYLKNKDASILEHLTGVITVDETIKLVSNKKKTTEEEKKLLAVPFFGYNYSEEEEFIADEMVLKFLIDNNKKVGIYKDALISLKDLLETTSELNVSSEINKLNVRIKRISNLLHKRER